MKHTLTAIEYDSEKVWLGMLVQTDDLRHALKFYVLTTHLEIDNDYFPYTEWADWKASLTYHRSSNSEFSAKCEFVSGGRCHWHDENSTYGRSLVKELRIMGVETVWYHLDKLLEKLIKEN